MKGIYIYYYYIDKEKKNGIEKKVLSQIELFKKKGFECELITYPYVHSFKTKILGRLPFTNVDPKWEYDNKFEKIDFIYLRRPFNMSYGFRKFLKNVKKNNLHVKIIVEIPTYPYDHELTDNFMNYPLLIKDRYNRKHMKGLIDCWTVIGEIDNREKLWDIPIIPFINGIKIDEIQPKEDKHVANEINLICVSTFEMWHGYDRLLKGLGKYYRDTQTPRNVQLYMVGDGLEKEKYSKIIYEEGIEEYVHLKGMLYKQELDKLYDLADIAIECLGMYRKKMNLSSSLKSREYLAKGLPIVAACKNDVIGEETSPYYLELENSEKDIDVSRIVEFYDKIYPTEESHTIVANKIRKYAENKIDLNVTMQPIVDFIK